RHTGAAARRRAKAAVHISGIECAGAGGGARVLPCAYRSPERSAAGGWNRLSIERQVHARARSADLVFAIQRKVVAREDTAYSAQRHSIEVCDLRNPFRRP